MVSIPPPPLVCPSSVSEVEAEPAGATASAAARAARIDWLFRDSVRRQVINPLHALVRAHSLKEGV